MMICLKDMDVEPTKVRGFYPPNGWFILMESPIKQMG